MIILYCEVLLITITIIPTHGLVGASGQPRPVRVAGAVDLDHRARRRDGAELHFEDAGRGLHRSHLGVPRAWARRLRRRHGLGVRHFPFSFFLITVFSFFIYHP